MSFSEKGEPFVTLSPFVLSATFGLAANRCAFAFTVYLGPKMNFKCETTVKKDVLACAAGPAVGLARDLPSGQLAAGQGVLRRAR